jgi:AhpD family alkylhydroperoxidase
VGFIPNLAATMAESPALLSAFLGLRSAAGLGSLSPVEREVIAIAVATETGCTYCVAAHSTFALKCGAPPAVVEAVRGGRLPEGARLEALARFARAVVRRADVRPSVRHLLQAGASPAQVLDAVAVIVVPLLAGSAFAVTAAALDGAFQPQAWAPPA